MRRLILCKILRSNPGKEPAAPPVEDQIIVPMNQKGGKI